MSFIVCVRSDDCAIALIFGATILWRKKIDRWSFFEAVKVDVRRPQPQQNNINNINNNDDDDNIDDDDDDGDDDDNDNVVADSNNNK